MSASIIELDHWFVLTTSDSKDSEEQLRRENIRRGAMEMECFRFFVPSQFLKRRVRHKSIGDENEMVYDVGCEGSRTAVLRNNQEVSQNNETRSALCRYVFIYGKEAEIAKFLNEDWNRLHHNRLQFFLDRGRRRCIVPSGSMDEFVRMLADRRLSFELCSFSGDFLRGECVVFKSGLFAGRPVRLVDVRRGSSGRILTVEVDLAGSSLRLRVFNVRDADIVRLDGSRAEYTRNSDLIKRNQARLLSILRRRVNGKETAESRMEDMLTLNTIYATRFRSFDESETVAFRHFIAQMLLCVCLLHDKSEVASYTEKVLAELAEIDRQGEARAATIVRARLHAVLFLSTGNPAYRSLARAYVREHQPRSPGLRTLVRLISKRQALKSI